MKTAIVGWRGMVGSVLLQRMVEENDFALIEAEFFSTSQAGEQGPLDSGVLHDAMDLDLLGECDIVLTCQGGGYTESVYGPLRERGWDGVWIDAASTLRMDPDSVIVLDPVNRDVIDAALESGIRCFAGGNCTVSLLLMAIAPLLKQGWVQWVNTMTYQAVSGAGAAAVLEMLSQNDAVVRAVAAAQPREARAGARQDAIGAMEVASKALSGNGVDSSVLGAPIASNVLPWIDRAVDLGQTREEWKGFAETNKILGLAAPVSVDGICVRVPTFRSHAQAVTLKLAPGLDLEAIEAAICEGHEWIDFVPNDRVASLERLTPVAVGGSLTIAVGRLRSVRHEPDMVSLFTVGDQLLWGAAEPLRRALRIVIDSRS